ncbi:methylase [Candidatus Scalindua japonica]|uniref:Methylase n=1 Tax=Candidatus Scalindua japonica TaxID=1284222 RepID=A0A286TTA3_9BACT|nr:methyltransferase domain-containing protein [Candidatus Scalindua japonica]GAX59093.1 methylase [Candidatus Scalindua japonica]
MAISREEVLALYQAGAKYYDSTINMLSLAGLRIKAYRSLAIDKLSLQRGNCVIELGCGTGLNFPFLMDQIGQEGQLIGVDLTPEMLDIARKRVKRSGWKNVELIQSDIATYDFPERANGVLAAGLLGYIPEYDRIIKTVSQSLLHGGHISILDGKQPEDLSSWLSGIVLKLGDSYGYTPEYFNVRPWKSVEHYFKDTKFETRYGGMIYISSGTVR